MNLFGIKCWRRLCRTVYIIKSTDDDNDGDDDFFFFLNRKKKKKSIAHNFTFVTMRITINNYYLLFLFLFDNLSVAARALCLASFTVVVFLFVLNYLAHSLDLIPFCVCFCLLHHNSLHTRRKKKHSIALKHTCIHDFVEKRKKIIEIRIYQNFLFLILYDEWFVILYV